MRRYLFHFHFYSEENLVNLKDCEIPVFGQTSVRYCQANEVYFTEFIPRPFTMHNSEFFHQARSIVGNDITYLQLKYTFQHQEEN